MKEWAGTRTRCHPGQEMGIHEPIHVATTAPLQKELRKTLKPGLPLSEATAGDLLPNLRNVVARSIHPDDLLSRVDALNQLLVRLIADLPDDELRQAAQILFGIAKGWRGAKLTSRFENCSELLGYDQDHFRKRVVPKVVELVAVELHRDLLHYKSRVRRAPAAEQATGDSPSLTGDDLTDQEELVSRVWQRVYGLRAELIAVGRLSGQPGFEAKVEDHRQAAEREHRELKRLIEEYVATYGDRFIRHGDAEYDAEGIVRLSGWRGLGTERPFDYYES